MKKALSIILTVALMLTVLPLGLFGLTASAAEETPIVAFDKITIGDKEYLIEKDGKYNARDTLYDIVDELPLLDEETQAAKFHAVDMSNSVWQLKMARYKSGYVSGYTYMTSKAGLPAIVGKANATSNSAWDTTWNQLSAAFGTDGALYVTPAVQGDKTAAAVVDMVFTAPKAGKVLIYDVLGAIAPDGQNKAPFYGWLDNNMNEVSVTILKNGEVIWPLDAETDNVIDDATDSVVFPDLGAIEVAANDTLTVRIREEGVVNNRTDHNGDGELEDPVGRDEVRTDIEIAYLYEFPVDEAETITVAGKDYKVNKNENFVLGDQFATITEGLELETNVDFSNINWNMAFRFTNDKDFGKNPWGEALSYKYAEVIHNGSNVVSSDLKGVQVSSYLAENNYSNSFANASVTFADNNRLYVSTAVAGALLAENIDTSLYGPAMKLAFTAYRDGKVVLYDTTGKFTGVGATYAAPFWANQSKTDEIYVKIEIYKNEELIWPLNGENNKICYTNGTIEFPELGELDVIAGDEISVRFFGNPEKPAASAGLFCSPAIAYAHEHNYVGVVTEPTETEFGYTTYTCTGCGDSYVTNEVIPNSVKVITLGGVNYPVYKDKVYTAYDSMIAATEGLTAGTEYTESDDEWKNKAYTGPEVSFADTPWGVVAGSWVGGTPYFIATDKRYEQIAFYRTNPAFGARSVSFFQDKLFVNPSHSWYKDTTEVPMQFNFTATEDGSVILYDTIGKVYSPATSDFPPFWNWNTSGIKTSFTILKNGTVIWPLNGEDNTIEAAGEEIAFPNLGAIGVKKGDVITVAVSSNKDRSGVFINPAVAYVYSKQSIEKFVINGKEYFVETNGKYNARDTLYDIVDELPLVDEETQAAKFHAVDMSNSVWQLKMARYKNGYVSGYTYMTAKSGLPAIVGKANATSNSAWDTSWNQLSAAFGTDGALYVTPAVQGDKTAAAVVDMVFTAPKAGKVLIYDVLGAIAPDGQNKAPFCGWLGNNMNEVSVTILKNGEVIWPLDAETDNVIDDVTDSLTFPDLGAIEVAANDTLTVRIREEGVVNNRTDHNGDGELEDPVGRDEVRTDIEIAYVHEHAYLDAHDELCNDCGAARAVAHDFDNDCDADCNTCGAIREVAHVYDDCTDADCNECGAERVAPGHKVWADCATSCDVCGAEVEATAEHVYNPECSRYCYNCYDDKGAPEHVFDNACDDTCNLCGNKFPVGDHVYDNECDVNCNECGAVREVAGHEYGADHKCIYCGIPDETPDHIDEDNDGYCDGCFKELETPHEHVYGEWVVTKDHTTSSTGLKERVCACGEKETKVIPVKIKAQNRALELQSNICVVYRVNSNLVKEFGYTDLRVEFTAFGETTVVTEYTEYTDPATGYLLYEFRFSNLAPQQMNDEIIATIYAYHDGEEYSRVYDNYSIVSYCKSQLDAADSSAELRTFLVDLINYGTAAQLKSGHNTANLAANELTELQKSYGTVANVEAKKVTNTKHEVIANPTLAYKVAALELADSVTVLIEIELTGENKSPEGIEVIVSAAGFTWTYNLAELDTKTADSGATRYVLKVKELNPNQMRNDITFKAKKDGEVISNTLLYSIESYVYGNAKDGDNSALANLLRAMLKYGVSAENYVKSLK